jgi:hypothetical protein
MACQTKNVGKYDDDEDEAPVVALDEGEFHFFSPTIPPSEFEAMWHRANCTKTTYQFQFP